MPYQDTSALQRQVQALLQSSSGNSWGSGLADGIKMWAGSRVNKKLEAAEKNNTENRARELAMLLKGAETGRVGDSYVAAPLNQATFTDPEIQQLAAKLRIEKASGAGDPSNVREWEYFSKLPEDQKEQYLTMRRGTSPINLGDRFEIPSQVSPGSSLGQFDVGIRPQDQPSLRGQQAAAVEAAQTAAIPGAMAAETQGQLDRTAALTQQTRSRDAMSALDLLDMAEPLLDVATGSSAGVARDKLGAVFGWSGDGAQAAAQLAALGGLLVSKMPRMEGPQSNYDQQLYREMAGQIGDPSIPNETRKAALQTIRQLNEKYAAQAPAAASPMDAADEILRRAGIIQ